MAGSLTMSIGLSVMPLPMSVAEPPPREVERGEPFDDGSYFDDGFGWVE